jgi:hypothetical protein
MAATPNPELRKRRAKTLIGTLVAAGVLFAAIGAAAPISASALIVLEEGVGESGGGPGNYDDTGYDPWGGGGGYGGGGYGEGGGYGDTGGYGDDGSGYGYGDGNGWDDGSGNGWDDGGGYGSGGGGYGGEGGGYADDGGIKEGGTYGDDGTDFVIGSDDPPGRSSDYFADRGVRPFRFELQEQRDELAHCNDHYDYLVAEALAAARAGDQAGAKAKGEGAVWWYIDCVKGVPGQTAISRGKVKAAAVSKGREDLLQVRNVASRHSKRKSRAQRHGD